MTRKAFLAGIVSLFGLALKPGAFMAALRKMAKPAPISLAFSKGAYEKMGRLLAPERPTGIAMRYIPGLDRIDILIVGACYVDEYSARVVG